MKLGKQIINNILIGLLFLVSSILIFVLINNRKASIDYIHAKLPVLLEEAIKENTENRTQKAPFSGLTHNPDKIGTIEDRIFATSDTTFTYKYKVTDLETELLQSKQSILLLTEELHSNDILVILDSLLNQNNITCQLTVGITASFYKKLNDWTPSNDTINTHFDYHTSLTKQGLFGDISYHTYINYSFKTLWYLMNQSLILSLLLLDILMLCFLVTRITKQKCHKQTEIKADVLPATTKELKLTGQLYELFQMFTDNNGLVNKESIKKTFWPHYQNSTTNMTTLIDRLKKKLSENENPYTIITDPENDQFYRLVPINKADTIQYHN